MTKIIKNQQLGNVAHGNSGNFKLLHCQFATLQNG